LEVTFERMEAENFAIGVPFWGETQLGDETEAAESLRDTHATLIYMGSLLDMTVLKQCRWTVGITANREVAHLVGLDPYSN
jgi:hypothetical protein